jgi:uncharacterized membrane protein YkvA (DUF1232 family)
MPINWSSLKQKSLSLRDDIYALYLASRDPRVPWRVKALILFTIGYFLSPIDLIPDFIPVIGYADDVLIIPALAAVAIKLIPKEVMDDCRARAKGELGRGRVRWVVAGVIVIVWVVVLLSVARLLWPALF